MRRSGDESSGASVRVLVFIALIVVETAMVVVAIRIATGSWAGGAAAGAISGGLTAATYPALVRRRRTTSRKQPDSD